MSSLLLSSSGASSRLRIFFTPARLPRLSRLPRLPRLSVRPSPACYAVDMRDRQASAGFRVFAIATALVTIGIAVSLRYDPEKPTKIVTLSWVSASCS